MTPFQKVYSWHSKTKALTPGSQEIVSINGVRDINWQMQIHRWFHESGYFCTMAKHKPFDIDIDKLTRSIENSITGDNFKTSVLPFTPKDIKVLKKSDWLFNWEVEAKQSDKTVYKLVIAENANIIQGLISLQDISSCR